MDFDTIYCTYFQAAEECRKVMLHRGKIFMKKLMNARGKIAKLASTFIADDSVSSPLFRDSNRKCIDVEL
jgi:hypothetical protein